MGSDSLATKYAALQTIVAAAGRVVVAYSGGVDSTLLLKVATDTLPQGFALGFLAATPLQPESERDQALSQATALGAQVRVIQLNPLEWPDFVANPANRCYLCKKQIYARFLEVIDTEMRGVLMDGTNSDDLSEQRPGRQAIQEYEIKTPLVDAGLGKAEIRRLSRQLGLPTWNKPSSSCLATRLATGLSITTSRLNHVARCEAYLHDLGFNGCRVRLDNDTSLRLELASGDLDRFCAGAFRTGFAVFCRSIGFQKLLLDLSERKGIVL